jgi:hypothetical protein
VVEAFSSTARGGPVLAVQWHPEWKPEANENSRKLFGLMGRVLRGGAQDRGVHAQTRNNQSCQYALDVHFVFSPPKQNQDREAE